MVMPQPVGRLGLADSCPFTQATRPTAGARHPSANTRSKATEWPRGRGGSQATKKPPTLRLVTASEAPATSQRTSSIEIRSVLRIGADCRRTGCRMTSTRRPRGKAVRPVTPVTCGRPLRAPERGLEAQVQEDAGVAFAGPDPDGHGHAGQHAVVETATGRVVAASTDFRTTIDFHHYQHRYIDAVA